MDVTLADYIKRTMKILEKDQPKETPKPVAEPDQYLVYPEDDGYDRPMNPFSQV